MSRRHDRKQARDGAHQLRRRPGWDPTSKQPGPSVGDQLRELSQRERTDTTFDAAPDCAACLARRAETKDDTALCEAHLREALGL